MASAGGSWAGETPPRPAPPGREAAAEARRDFHSIADDLARETEALAPLVGRLEALRASYAGALPRGRALAERSDLRGRVEAGASSLRALLREADEAGELYYLKHSVRAFTGVARGARPPLTPGDIRPHLAATNAVRGADRLRSEARRALSEDAAAFASEARRASARRTMAAAAGSLAGGLAVLAALAAWLRRRSPAPAGVAAQLGPRFRRTLPDKR